MVDARTRRRRDAAEAGSLAAASSLLAHLVVLAIMAAGLKRQYVLPSTRATALDVELTAPWSTARPPEKPFDRLAAAPATRAQPQRIVAPSIVPGPSSAAAPTAPSPATQAAPASSATASGALASALRGSIGCDHADLVALSPAEREHCRHRFATAGSDPGDLTSLGLDPVKRAAFDAAWTADHSPQHMAAIGCFMRFGGGKVQWLRPSEGFRLGRLPCYFVAPKATFSADPPPAPPTSAITH